MDKLTRQLLTLVTLKWAGVGAMFLGVTITLWLVILDRDGLPRRLWERYVAYLDRKLKVLFIWTPGSQIASAQLAGIGAVCGLALAVSLPYWYAFAVLVAVVPPLYIEQLRRRRIAAIEAQLDGFLLAIANALKATPSIGDAFASVQQLTRPPLQQEIELAIKEMRVGSTLDQAILLMASRIGSRQVDSALSALLIGRQIGGNLPKILDTTSSTIREIARLDAVVRTKTAEGKAQLTLLSIFPVALIFGFNAVREHYFDPLTQSVTGYIIIAIAGLCWIASLVLARKIISVDV